MNNNSQTSTNPETPKKLRVESVHGGDNVEEIKAPEPISDTSGHVHEWELDSSEKDFTAFMCKHATCGAVILYDKL